MPRGNEVPTRPLGLSAGRRKVIAWHDAHQAQRQSSVSPVTPREQRVLGFYRAEGFGGFGVVD